jgi:hypothetical protein
MEIRVSLGAEGKAMARIKLVLHRACIAVAGTLVLGSGGCATGGNLNLTSYFSGAPPKPTKVVINDFDVAPGSVSADHGLTAGYRHKLGKISPDQLKLETTSAFDEAVTNAMIAKLADGGLSAVAASNDSGSRDEPTVVVSGHVHKVDDKDRMKRRVSGLAPYRSSVIADVQVSQETGGAHKDLLAFVGEPDSAPKTTAAADPGPATTGNTGDPPKLMPGVAADARRIGEASAIRILAFAAEQGWITKQAQN